MNTLEDDIRTVLRSQANAMQVPEPHLSRSIPLTVVPALGPDTDPVESNEVDPIEDFRVFRNNPTSETSDRRRALLAAAAVVAVIGVTGIALAISTSSDDKTRTPAAATTVAPTTIVQPASETVRFTATRANIPMTFTVPDDWTVEDGWAVHKGAGVGEVGLNFTEIGNIYADGCQWERLDPPVGPTVDDLARAWANVPDVAATAPVDVTVDGYAGMQVEFTVPDYNTAECEGLSAGMPEYGLWYAAGDAFPGFWAHGPNQHTQQQILDVNGTRLVITTYYVPTTSPQDRAALYRALASIQIG